ncbi:hypothetical protein [Sorangium sp. So ce1099]|uniref:hypothetical protein n=1 Tax=Sorangium sp. So ce1099 TaxID=3133331 RepID=UPI003F63B4A7
MVAHGAVGAAGDSRPGDGDAARFDRGDVRERLDADYNGCAACSACGACVRVHAASSSAGAQAATAG